MEMDVNLIISKIRNLFSYLASTLLLLSCSNMAVKEFKPDTYFSRKVDLEMAMADAIYYGEKKLVRDYINTGRVDINRPGKAGFTFLICSYTSGWWCRTFDTFKLCLCTSLVSN